MLLLFIRILPMPNSIYDDSFTYNFKKDPVIAYSQSIFRRKIGQLPDISFEIICHFFYVLKDTL